MTTELEQIEQSIKILCEPDCVFKIRVLKTKQKTKSGYFDNMDDMAINALSLTNDKSPAVYFTLNPVPRDCLSRANNRVQDYAENTTTDEQILRRCRVLIDCDPERLAGISSTDAEHDAAIKHCREIRAFLTDAGFPLPLLGDSGNGCHLVYSIDLPNDDDSAQLVKRFSESLDTRFPNDGIKVDTTVWNASRISKLYGTWARKGDSTKERPHRLSGQRKSVRNR